MAVIELQDNKALRLALAARPRKVQAFEPGASVAYWRTQKSHEGVIERGGRWYGPRVVLGYVGRNLVIVHKRNIFRCAPEQVRASTSEEESLATTPHLEILGIKNLIDSGSLQSRQYVDLVPQGAPPAAAPEASAEEDAQMPQASQPVAPPIGQLPTLPPQEAFREEHASQAPLSSLPSTQAHGQAAGAEPGEEGYGPVRHRVSQKSSPVTLHRPRAMLPDDFSDMMQAVAPRLVASAIRASSSDEPSTTTDSAGQVEESRGRKREASTEPASESKRQATDADVPSDGIPSGPEGTEDLYVALEANMNPKDPKYLSPQEILAVEAQNPQVSVECLVAAHINKRAAKEIPAVGNVLEVQSQVDEAKLIEWNTISCRNAARIVLGDEAVEIRRRHADRIMGSRFVCTWKQEEEGPKRVKARWCLQSRLRS